MDVSNFLKKLKKRLSEKKQNELKEVHGANSEEGEEQNRVSDEKQSDVTENNNLHLHDQTNNHVERELANVNSHQHINNNIFRERDSITNKINNSTDEDEDEKEENVFFTATFDDTTHQSRRRKPIVSNAFHHNNNNMMDEQPPVTLNEIRHYNILKDLPALNVMRANAKEQGFHAQRSTPTSLASTRASQLSLRQRRHTLISAMQAKAQETSIDKNYKHTRHELKTIHSISSTNDSTKNMEKTNGISDDTIAEKMNKRVKFEEEKHALNSPTMAANTENANNEDNFKVNHEVIKMLSVDELLSSESEAVLPINIDFNNLNSSSDVIADTSQIANNTETQKPLEEESLLEWKETNVAEKYDAHSNNAKDNISNTDNTNTSCKSNAQLDASTLSATKTSTVNPVDVTKIAVAFTAASSVDDESNEQSAPPSKQIKKLNAFARAKLIAQNGTLPGNNSTLNTKHDDQIRIQHF